LKNRALLVVNRPYSALLDTDLYLNSDAAGDHTTSWAACSAAPEPQVGCGLAMTPQTESADIGKVAFTASLAHRQNMVRVPETAAARTPLPFEPSARGVVELSLVAAQHFGIGAASRAYPTVALEYLLPQISRVGAQLPFTDTQVRAERKASLGSLLPAPAAEVSPMRTLCQATAVYTTTLFGSPGARILRFGQGKCYST
jgi:hypothetical protein